MGWGSHPDTLTMAIAKFVSTVAPSDPEAIKGLTASYIIIDEVIEI